VVLQRGNDGHGHQILDCLSQQSNETGLGKREEEKDLGPPDPKEFKKSKPEPGDSEFNDALVLIKTDGGKGGLPCPGPWQEFQFTYRRAFFCSDYDMKTGDPDMNAQAAEWAKFLAGLSFSCPLPCLLQVQTSMIGSACHDDWVIIPVKVKVKC